MSNSNLCTVFAADVAVVDIREIHMCSSTILSNPHNNRKHISWFSLFFFFLHLEIKCTFLLGKIYNCELCEYVIANFVAYRASVFEADYPARRIGTNFCSYLLCNHLLLLIYS